MAQVTKNYRTSTASAEETGLSARLRSRLAQLEQANLRRSLAAADRDRLSFCDNDYLGLATDLRLQQAANGKAMGGAASRLVDGNHAEYAGLEHQLAQLKQSEAALVFSSGFAMNSSVLPALAQKGDKVLADKLSHASLIDGMRYSEARFQRFPHNDMAALERLLQQQRAQVDECFIVTESIFSMDGDAAPVPQLIALAERYDCHLLLDDAHGFGLVKTGVPAYHPRVIHLGTLSKAVGTLGGYLAASQAVVDYLVNHCRSLIYSTALPPSLLAASSKALQIMAAEPWRGRQACAHARYFAERLRLPAPAAAIVPLVLGEEAKVLAAAETLKAQGFKSGAIRPPTVPAGTARLRFTFSARHTPEQVDALAAAVEECLS